MNSPDNPASELEFDYEDVEAVLADGDVDTSAAELQAFLCGMLAAGLKKDDQSWRDALVDMVNEGHPLTSEATGIVQGLFAWTYAQMNEHDSLAPVLLPDDGYPAIDQLEALIDWGQGFLLGFGLQTGNQTIDNPEVKESLSDIAEICHLEPQAEDNEESLEALMTLVEHIRVAVQIIHWEMVAKTVVQAAPVSEESPTLH